MKLDEIKIKDILLRENYVTAEDMKRAEAFVKSHHTRITDYLMSENVITKELLGQAIAESMSVPYANLVTHPPSREQVQKIPQSLAQRHRVVFFNEQGKEVTVATDNPSPSGLSGKLQKVFRKKKVRLAYAFSEDIDTAFIHYRKPLETRFSQILNQRQRIAPEIVDEIIEDAVALRASDIHIEPQERDVLVRFRIDGVLHDAGRVPKEHFENILNRIKIQAHLRIDEHFAAQDGAMRLMNAGTSVDLRVSVIPTFDGEKIAIRLLSEYVRNFTLADLGLSSQHQALLLEGAKKPFGMILVTGPTGSGKTTTLYALLKVLNSPDVNITTIEDPVEYKVVGINQIQVNPNTSLTFAQGLRSIIRQDPDIVLVGEIRDRETAEIAVNAALTGHLLLSTFHANDAATGIPRLLDMGVEPFLAASTLELIVAQRLVRTICSVCRVSEPVSLASLQRRLSNASKYFSGSSVTLFHGKGCSTCNGTGYEGRTAIFEFIPITRDMEELILRRPSTKEIWDLATKQGAHSLFEDGLEKVKNGKTTLEELMRVAPPS